MNAKHIVGAVAALSLVATAVFSVENSKIEYMDFAHASTSGRVAQVAGTWVKANGMQYDAELNEFRFTMADETGAEMPVVLHAAKPNNFEMSVSVVATGQVENGVFSSTNVLTKCPSKYEAQGDDIANPHAE